MNRENGLAVFLEKTIEHYKKETPDAEKQKKKEVAVRIREQERVDKINANEQKRRLDEQKSEQEKKALQENARKWFYTLAD